MMGLFVSCREMGVVWCDFEANGASEQELLDILAKHIVAVHDGDEAQLRTDEGAAMLRAMVREVGP